MPYFHHETSQYLNAPLSLNIPNVRIYQYFEENEVFLRSFWKNRFFANISFREKGHFFEIMFKNRLLPIHLKISIYRRKRGFLWRFWNNRVCPYLREYQHFGAKLVFMIILNKTFFVHKSVNIKYKYQNIYEKFIILRSFWKICIFENINIIYRLKLVFWDQSKIETKKFFPYLRKFWGKACFLRLFWKRRFLTISP